MTSDTLWQKYVYDTPFDDDEMPLLNSRKSTIDGTRKTFEISGKSLYGLDSRSFEKICKTLMDGNFGNVVIIDDYQFRSNNSTVVKGSKAHMMSFCHLFQKKGFNAIVSTKKD